MAKYGLDRYIVSIHLYAPLRYLIYLNPGNWRIRRRQFSQGKALRLALEELGPIFVKFGQMLSVRRDLLPPDIADELSKLQDDVPPFSSEMAKEIVRNVLKQPLEEVFYHFEEAPLASASIAQVHAATLLDGQDVVVKIRRPDIERQIHRDMKLIMALARLSERYSKEMRRLRPTGVVNEFKKTLEEELDFTYEAANASQLKRNFQDSKILHVPSVYWSLTHDAVMVQERIHGVPISDIDALKKHGVNLKRLAEIGVEIFFTQVFRDRFFHADMHPGNIFVDCTNPQEPSYIVVDFGIMGSLSPYDQRYLAENFLAFFKQDYRLVSELHINSGWVPRHTRVDEFESAIRMICEPIFDTPLKDISVALMLLRLFQVGRRFNMHIQPQLVLLQKTLFAIEGLGRRLCPELDLWKSAKPYLDEWLFNRLDPRNLFGKIKAKGPVFIEQLLEMPELVHEQLKHKRQAHIHEHCSFEKRYYLMNRMFIKGVTVGVILMGFIYVLGR